MYLRVHVYVRAGADTCCSLEFVVGVMFWSCLPNPVLGQSSGKLPNRSSRGHKFRSF